MFRASYLATAIGPPRCWLIIKAHVTVGRWPASHWEAARLAEGRKFESWWRQSFFQHKFWSHNLLQLKFPLIFLPQTTLWQHVGKLCQLSPGISQEHVKVSNSGHWLFSMNCHSAKWLLHRLSQNHHKCNHDRFIIETMEYLLLLWDIRKFSWFLHWRYWT